MARPLSEKFTQALAELRLRLESGYYIGGTRFFSNRDLAARYGVSYQTAHRLIRLLCAEGLLRRQVGAGTFVAGTTPSFSRVDLYFSARASEEGRFGHRLLEEVTRALRREGIPNRITYTAKGDDVTIPPDSFPVIWESPVARHRLLNAAGFGLLLNENPPQSLSACHVDSVALYDEVGGAYAGELLSRLHPDSGLFRILGGPFHDPRSLDRIRGAQRFLPHAEVIDSGSWYAEDAGGAIALLLRNKPRGVFCCNDRLAAAVHLAAQARGWQVAVIGFDNAPVAERLGLPTIAIPWSEMADAAVHIIQRRLSGRLGGALRQTLTPRPMRQQRLE